MSARKKLNGMYLSGAAVFAAFAGLLSTSWAAFAVVFAVTVGVHLMAGNIRLANGHR